ncbi:MAG: hypothetical protein JNK15_24160 [Planctomycetes bacterium]|nr:hypothetical protein [Planctomycetota bacterium]
MVQRSVVAVLALAATAVAQVPQLIPYGRQVDLLVVDSSYDGVWRLSDQNQDGDYNDPGERISYYSDLIGSITLTNPTCIVCAPDGTAYVGDSTVDIVLALRDLNGDGDANDPGEHTAFYHSTTNANATVMASVQGITVDAIGRLFCAVSNAGTSGTDLVLQLQDGNGDGDADDLGESFDYCTIPGGAGAVGNSIPTKVVVGPDLNLYYTEVSTGTLARGAYRLADNNTDGDCNDPGEVTLHWSPVASTPFYWSLAVDPAGWLYMTDHNTIHNVWRGRDLDSSGTIDAAEMNVFWQGSAGTWFDAVWRDDGTLLVFDSSGDTIRALRDLNADGDATDPGEATLALDPALAPGVAPRAGAFLRAASLNLVPPSVQVGNATNLTTQTTRPGDLVVTVIAYGLGVNFPLAPWGTVELDITAFATAAVGFADPAGQFAAAFPIPNNPALVGSFAFQSLAGDAFRLFLSNASVLAVTP